MGEGRVMELAEVADVLDFPVLLPSDVRLLAPTTYSRLNLLNYCQQLKCFLRAELHPDKCGHTDTLDAKLEVVRCVISNIVETDSVVCAADLASK